MIYKHAACLCLSLCALECFKSGILEEMPFFLHFIYHIHPLSERPCSGAVLAEGEGVKHNNVIYGLTKFCLHELTPNYKCSFTGVRFFLPFSSSGMCSSPL